MTDKRAAAFLPCDCYECKCSRVVTAEAYDEQRAAGDNPICDDCAMGDHNEADADD